MAVDLLVVDDEPDLELIIKRQFKDKIKKGEYRFSFAQNGSEALDLLHKNESINLVLTDINMPVMDGLTLVKEIAKLERVLEVVIISAYSDMQNIRTAMNRGAFDFLVKPIDLEDLKATVEKTIEIIRIKNQNIRSMEENLLLKVANKELEKLVQKEKEISMMKDEFTSNINHELRTPLTSLLMTTEYLVKNLDGLSVGDAIKRIERINRSANNLLIIVNELLDFSRLEAGKFSCNPSLVELSPIFKHLQDTFEGICKSKGIELHIEQGEELSIINDPNHMLKILSNLVGNAYKFTDQGKITIKTAKIKNFIYFTISDTGCGIDKDDIKTIFDRFSQGKIQNNKAPGTGIGLHMARKLSENHGGSINASSVLSQGSVFTVCLPLKSKWEEHIQD